MTEHEPEYQKINVPVTESSITIRPDFAQSTGPFVRMVVCNRCGSYVWDLQAHEHWHGN